MTLQTEYPFTLPKGYVDEDGTLHRDGVMRLATARDEIAPLRDLKVQDNEAYLTVVILSRVVTRLGTISPLNTGVIEGLFASDLAYLQDLYGIINFGDPSVLQAGGGEEDPLVEEEEEDEAPSKAKAATSNRRRGAAVEEVTKKG